MHNYNIISVVEDIVLSAADYIKNTERSIVFDTEEEEVILACRPSYIEKIMLNNLT